MYQDDYYNPADPNDFEYDFEQAINKAKKADPGYNTIYRKAPGKDGKWRNKKIGIYTTGGVGSLIRDAETGDTFPNAVGSKDEELFFKVALATGECSSANKSNILFFVSPQSYANHMCCDVDPVLAYSWEKRRDERLAEINILKRQRGTVRVH